jgi:hypothetical protein
MAVGASGIDLDMPDAATHAALVYAPPCTFTATSRLRTKPV